MPVLKLVSREGNGTELMCAHTLLNKQNVTYISKYKTETLHKKSFTEIIYRKANIRKYSTFNFKSAFNLLFFKENIVKM